MFGQVAHLPRGTLEIKTKNKIKLKNQTAVSEESYLVNKTKNKFLTRTLYSPIIVKISVKRSSSTGVQGREQKDKERAVAVTQLSTT